MSRLSRDALITAFVAGDLFIVLPSLIEASSTLAGRGTRTGIPNPRTCLTSWFLPRSTSRTPASSSGISFILFAGWFADTVVPLSDYPQLALTGLLTFFGSLNAAGAVSSSIC